MVLVVGGGGGVVVTARVPICWEDTRKVEVVLCSVDLLLAGPGDALPLVMGGWNDDGVRPSSKGQAAHACP